MSKKALNQTRKAKKIGGTHRVAKVYQQILVVSEDSKSSVDYLNALWRDLSRSKEKALQKSVVIRGSHKGSSPDKVCESAQALNIELGGFDEMYCVMDVDSHQTLNKTLHEIRNNNSENPISHAIVSNPCFEYWILLHLEDSSAPFVRKSNKSACDCVGQRIRTFNNQGFAQYKKSGFDLFNSLNKLNAQNDAVLRSRRILNTGNPENINPSTNFHMLIERLLNQATQ